MATRGLVLSGGGARGAYQVGVLNAIANVAQEMRVKYPFQIYTGLSAGAINATYLASGAHDFSETAKSLSDMWSQLEAKNIFYTDALNMGKIGLGWLEELSFGALTGSSPGRSLLNTAPLRELIQKNLQFENIDRNIKDGILHAVAISATSYQDSHGLCFVQGKPEIQSWKKPRHESHKTILAAEHVMASAAIPLLFPPIQVGDKYFGDGCIRNQSPCGPAIYLGSDKIFVIGVRNQESDWVEQKTAGETKAPSVAKVLNTLLNAVMLDGVELDLEKLSNINRFAKLVPEEQRKGLKQIEYAYISPSVDIGKLAAQRSSRLPRIVRYLLRGLGNVDDASEIISYLLFDPGFLSQLIEIGFTDGMQNRDQIERFLTD